MFRVERELGLTAATIADRADISASTLNAFMCGRTSPRCTTLQKLLPALRTLLADRLWQHSGSEAAVASEPVATPAANDGAGISKEVDHD